MDKLITEHPVQVLTRQQYVVNHSTGNTPQHISTMSVHVST